MTDVAAPRSRLASLVDFARREPGQCLAVVLVLHVLAWTLLPALLSHNLQLDLAEDLALGREWQLGYWKHPPLPWWAADLAYRIAGDVHAVYLLGPLAAAVCMYVVWLLGRDILGGFQSLIAVLALEGLHFFNFSVPKFAHDQMQLPFWALTGLFLYRAIARERLLDWLLAGLALALCFWSKYAAFALAGSIGLFMLFDPVARRTLRTSGPWLMALAFLVAIAPNLIWLVDSGFMPLRYVDGRAKLATHWYHFFTFPLQWSAGQLFFLAPTIALMALALAGGRARTPPDEPFARRYVTMLAVGPFAITTTVALVLGRLPVAMWGYPLWSFAPLAALLWFGPVSEPLRLRRFSAGFLVIFAAMPLAYAAVEGLEPLIRDRPKATQFPGRQLAATVTQRWREKFATPLPYVGGGEFATNNIAVYSPDRPHAIVHADLTLSPWIDPADLWRRGAVLVWEDGQIDAGGLAQLRSNYPGLDVQEPLTLPRQTWGGRSVRPVRVHVAFVPPGRSQRADGECPHRNLPARDNPVDLSQVESADLPCDLSAEQHSKRPQTTGAFMEPLVFTLMLMPELAVVTTVKGDPQDYASISIQSGSVTLWSARFTPRSRLQQLTHDVTLPGSSVTIKKGATFALIEPSGTGSGHLTADIAYASADYPNGHFAGMVASWPASDAPRIAGRGPAGAAASRVARQRLAAAAAPSASAAISPPVFKFVLDPKSPEILLVTTLKGEPGEYAGVTIQVGSNTFWHLPLLQMSPVGQLPYDLSLPDTGSGPMTIKKGATFQLTIATVIQNGSMFANLTYITPEHPNGQRFNAQIASWPQSSVPHGQ